MKKKKIIRIDAVRRIQRRHVVETSRSHVAKHRRGRKTLPPSSNLSLCRLPCGTSMTRSCNLAYRPDRMPWSYSRALGSDCGAGCRGLLCRSWIAWCKRLNCLLERAQLRLNNMEILKSSMLGFLITGYLVNIFHNNIHLVGKRGLETWHHASHLSVFVLLLR